MDPICDSSGFMGAGTVHRLHAGRHHSCPAGGRHYCDPDSGFSRTKTGLTCRAFARQNELLKMKWRIMNLKKLLMGIVLILSICAFAACDFKGPAEKTGEKIDQTMEEAADNVEKAAEAVKDKAEDIRREVEKSTQ